MADTRVAKLRNQGWFSATFQAYLHKGLKKGHFVIYAFESFLFIAQHRGKLTCRNTNQIVRQEKMHI
ncbi:uncharacterized protein METZ01_LOCUS357434, partial [marine metagenome]